MLAVVCSASQRHCPPSQKSEVLGSCRVGPSANPALVLAFFTATTLNQIEGQFHFYSSPHPPYFLKIKESRSEKNIHQDPCLQVKHQRIIKTSH